MDKTNRSNLLLDRPLPSLLNLAQSQSRKNDECDLVATAVASAYSFSSFVVPGAAAGSILHLLPELQPSSSKYYYDSSDDANFRQWSLLDRALILESIEPYATQLSSSLYETYTFVNDFSGPSGLRLAKTSRPLSIAACFVGFINKKYQKHEMVGMRVSSDKTDSPRTNTTQRDTLEDKQNVRFEYEHGGRVRRKQLGATGRGRNKDDLLRKLNLRELQNFILDIQRGNIDIEVATSIQVTDKMLGTRINFKAPKNRFAKIKPKKSTSVNQTSSKKQGKLKLLNKRAIPQDDQVMFFLYSGDGQRYSCSFEKIKESKQRPSGQVAGLFCPNQTTSGKADPLPDRATARQDEKEFEEDVEELAARLNFHKRDHFDDYSLGASIDTEYLKDNISNCKSLQEELKVDDRLSAKSQYFDTASYISEKAMEAEMQRSVSVPNLNVHNFTGDNATTDVDDDDGDGEADETKSLMPIQFKSNKSGNLRIKLLKDSIKKKIQKGLPSLKSSKIRPTERRNRSSQKYADCMKFIKMCTAQTDGFEVTLYMQPPGGFDKCKLKTDFLIHLMKLFFSSPKDKIEIRSVSHIADELETIIEQNRARPKFAFDFENMLICRAVLVVPVDAGVLIQRQDVFFLDNICEILEISQEQIMVLLADK